MPVLRGSLGAMETAQLSSPLARQLDPGRLDGELAEGATRGSFTFRPMALLAVAAVMAASWYWVPELVYLLGFLGVIIVAHEGGHFVAARAAGMRPTEFFWGFGPEILAVTHGDCRYGIKLLFLGGYVKLEGMTPTSELPEGFNEADTFRHATHRGRLITILAGPLVNVAMAIAAFAVVKFAGGAGLAASLMSSLAIVWEIVSLTGLALWQLAADLGAYVAAVVDTSGQTVAPVRFLSPVGQARFSGQAVDMGADGMLLWFGVLSCAVGVINLVPLPPLDGSHAMVAITEGVLQRVLRRPVQLNVAHLLPLAYLTIGVLLAISVSALVLDIRELI